MSTFRDIPGFDEDFGADDTVMCTVCHTDYDQEQIDLHEPAMYEVDGEKVCGYCIDLCEGCNESLTDEWTKALGKTVRVRQWAQDGKLEPFHAECAGESLLRTFSGDYQLSLDHTDKDAIAEIVAAAFPQEVLR